MLKKIFKYRGRRIRYSSRNLLLLYRLFLFIPVIASMGYFIGYQMIYKMIVAGESKWLDYVLPTGSIIAISVFYFILIHFFIRLSIIRTGYFCRIEQRQTLARLLIDNNYYTKKQQKGSDGKTKEKIKLPKVYYRNRGDTFEVTFETKGSRFQEKFLTMGSFLETALFADVINQVDEKGYTIYELMSDVLKKRIDIKEMVADENGVKLMNGLYWDFDSDPHLLVGGGTGGGKTFTILSLIYGLMRIGDIEICDPKRSDLMALGKLPIFEGKVHTGKAMVDCVKNVVAEMNLRFEKMGESKKFKMGKNYAYYGFKPKFVVVDEFAAWMAELGKDYQTAGEVEDALTQIILKARQCGIYFIVAMQRPDGEYIKTSLRDNFMFRMSVGRLTETGYWMIFGVRP